MDTDTPERDLRNVQSELSQIEDQIKLLMEKKHKLKIKQNILKQLLKESISSAKTVSKDWSKAIFTWSNTLEENMKSLFKISGFRPYQMEVMNATMAGEDCILIMPTGGGKSLCYQLPAIISDGFTIVVSPLVSLMEDQVHCLEANGLGHACSFLSAGKTPSETTKIMNEMINPKSKLKIFYVTPEKIAKSKRFMSKLEKAYSLKRFNRLAIDEVHCISQWGHDFRTDYKILGIMKKQFPNVPILGLTATLTNKVGIDVKTLLGIQGCLQFKASFNRPNLKYIVLPKKTSTCDVISDIYNFILKKHSNSSGIIYCLSIKDCEEVASNLRNRRISAAAYHAQLDSKVRSKVHSQWLQGAVKVVVATIAFGMGINKPDVRFVIHHSISKSMENYYQESGRAGRDGDPADCVIFFRLNDLFRLSTMVFQDYTGLENLYAMAAYCISQGKCRRTIIANHFGESWNRSDCQNMCDACEKLNTDFEEDISVDVTKYCLHIYKIILDAKETDVRLTALKIVDALKQKKNEDAVPVPMTRESYELIITLLLIEGFLKEDFHFTAYTIISYIQLGMKSHAVQSGKLSVILPLTKHIKNKLSKVNRSNDNLVTKSAFSDQNNPKSKPHLSKDPKSKKKLKLSTKRKGVLFEDSSDDDISIIDVKKNKIEIID